MNSFCSGLVPFVPEVGISKVVSSSLPSQIATPPPKKNPSISKVCLCLNKFAYVVNTSNKLEKTKDSSQGNY